MEYVDRNPILHDDSLSDVIFLGHHNNARPDQNIETTPAVATAIRALRTETPNHDLLTRQSRYARLTETAMARDLSIDHSDSGDEVTAEDIEVYFLPPNNSGDSSPRCNRGSR